MRAANRFQNLYMENSPPRSALMPGALPSKDAIRAELAKLESWFVDKVGKKELERPVLV